MAEDGCPPADAMDANAREKCIDFPGGPTDGLAPRGWATALARTHLILAHDGGIGCGGRSRSYGFRAVGGRIEGAGGGKKWADKREMHG